MRVGIISDIHANRVALEAALNALAGARVHQMVCLGDVAATGPQPREVLQWLRELGCPVVMGNCDQHMLDLRMAPAAAASARSNDPPGLIDDVDRWCAAQVSEDELAFVRTFQPTVSIDLGAGRTLLCYHGSPHSFHDLVFPFTTDEELAGWFADQEAELLAGGHTHCQMLRRYGTHMLINPGSVGLPFDRYAPAEAAYNVAWAEYALITSDGPRLRIEFHRTPYDLDNLARATRAGGMPHADEFLADWRNA